tara:strand:- start:1178 stop:1561 length:384 start_codon:yes stop_codon:yes gene_type:complete
MGSDANIDELHIYLHEIADTPFKWGRHDCFLFTNTAFKKMYGEGWADDWAHRYLGGNRLPFKRSILQSEYGFETFEEAVDSKLTELKTFHLEALWSQLQTGFQEVGMLGSSWELQLVQARRFFLQKV